MVDYGTPYELVMTELIAAQATLYAYICALTGHSQAARDILQETNLKICRRVGTYDSARPFMPWAKRIAVYEVMTYRTRQRRDRLVFEDDVFERLLEQADSGQEAFETERYLSYLDACIRKLPDTLRQVVDSRYLKGEPVGLVARRIGRSANAVSLLLMRARQLLSDCVRLAAEQGGGE
ncbi:MAG: sigma-70 family RNA polymerase sigma factor [Kiritimatiellia bacterium]|jgi:RNA polymerase sigma-70 factor (ECF subfamily)|nr:sigma-70 family RNA polymerase sigma factor [Kiritimatiellia bacterium]